MNWLFVIGIAILVLVPFMPKLVRLRIRALRWLHWNWAAKLLEKHFDGWVLFFRIVVFIIALFVFYTGWEDLHN